MEVKRGVKRLQWLNEYRKGRNLRQAQTMAEMATYLIEEHIPWMSPENHTFPWGDNPPPGIAAFKFQREKEEEARISKGTALAEPKKHLTKPTSGVQLWQESLGFLRYGP